MSRITEGLASYNYLFLSLSEEEVENFFGREVKIMRKIRLVNVYGKLGLKFLTNQLI